MSRSVLDSSFFGSNYLKSIRVDPFSPDEVYARGAEARAARARLSMDDYRAARAYRDVVSGVEPLVSFDRSDRSFRDPSESYWRSRARSDAIAREVASLNDFYRAHDDSLRRRRSARELQLLRIRNNRDYWARMDRRDRIEREVRSIAAAERARIVREERRWVRDNIDKL